MALWAINAHGIQRAVVDARLSVAEYQAAHGLLLHALVKEAKVRGAIFFHLESALEQRNVSLLQKFQVELKLRRVKAFQPLDTQMLDLHQDEAALLAAMHEKTRYNIRLAEKRGVQVQVATGSGVAAALEQFILLNKQTAMRDKFTSHASTYYRRLHEHLGDDVLRVYVAMFEQQPIAANIVMHFGDTATYVHGASSNSHRNVMARTCCSGGRFWTPSWRGKTGTTSTASKPRSAPAPASTASPGQGLRGSSWASAGRPYRTWMPMSCPSAKGGIGW